MCDRKYSLSEIDQMRLAVRSLTLQYGVVYRSGQLDEQVEDRLRTYMQNGTDPEELQQAVESRR